MPEDLDLAARRCQPCERGGPALSRERASEMLARLNRDWKLADDARGLERTVPFGTYHEVIAFVNAVAWIAHREDHHPDLSVHYGKVVVRYSTHAVGGLSDNDFICAAKVDALLA